MSNKRLNIVDTKKNSNQKSPRNEREAWRQEAEAQFERMWLIDPEQFDPMRNCMERERLSRTWALTLKFIDPKNKWAADLACGGGVLSKHLKEVHANVHALDIASNALKIVHKNVPDIEATFQQCLPHTTLEDDKYDLVFANEVIAYLPSTQLRLFMAELCRLVKPDGFVICSTGLDLDSQDPLLRFSGLADTEFKVHQWICSYHRLYIRLLDFFSAPEIYAKAYKDREYRQKMLDDRRGFSQKWMRWNSQGLLGIFWMGVQYLSSPISQFMNQNKTWMLTLEKLCRALWGDNGISHAIFIASRRPLLPLELPKDEIPIERKEKRHIWE